MGENAERGWHVRLLVGDGDRDVIFYIKIIEQRTKKDCVTSQNHPSVSSVYIKNGHHILPDQAKGVMTCEF